MILPKNPEKAANKPDTTENFSPAIFSMKISQVRFSLHKIIFHEINQYHFFFLLKVCLHFISYRSVSRCGSYHPAEVVDKLSKQSIFMCYQMLCFVWAFYINTILLITFLFQSENTMSSLSSFIFLCKWTVFTAFMVKATDFIYLFLTSYLSVENPGGQMPTLPTNFRSL